MIEGVVQEIDIASGNVIFEWHSLDHVGIAESYPRTKPTATAQREADGSTIVHAIWNGATDVFRWDVLDASGEESNRDWSYAERGSSRGHDESRRIASVTWNGLDTIIPVDKYLTSVRVVARDRAGREIGRSDTTAVSP